MKDRIYQFSCVRSQKDEHQIDVPEVAVPGRTLPAFTKLFGAASIYCISPCTEETAKAFAAQLRSEGFSLYEAPRLPAPSQAAETDFDEPGSCHGCGEPISASEGYCADCEANHR